MHTTLGTVQRLEKPAKANNTLMRHAGQNT